MVAVVDQVPHDPLPRVSVTRMAPPVTFSAVLTAMPAVPVLRAMAAGYTAVSVPGRAVPVTGTPVATAGIVARGRPTNASAGRKGTAFLSF